MFREPGEKDLLRGQGKEMVWYATYDWGGKCGGRYGSSEPILIKGMRLQFNEE